MEFGINVHRLLGEFEDSSMEETTNTTKRERRRTYGELLTNLHLTALSKKILNLFSMTFLYNPWQISYTPSFLFFFLFCNETFKYRTDENSKGFMKKIKHTHIYIHTSCVISFAA